MAKAVKVRNCDNRSKGLASQRKICCFWKRLPKRNTTALRSKKTQSRFNRICQKLIAQQKPWYLIRRSSARILLAVKEPWTMSAETDCKYLRKKGKLSLLIRTSESTSVRWKRGHKKCQKALAINRQLTIYKWRLKRSSLIIALKNPSDHKVPLLGESRISSFNIERKRAGLTRNERAFWWLQMKNLIVKVTSVMIKRD